MRVGSCLFHPLKDEIHPLREVGVPEYPVVVAGAFLVFHIKAHVDRGVSEIAIVDEQEILVTLGDLLVKTEEDSIADTQIGNVEDVEHR